MQHSSKWAEGGGRRPRTERGFGAEGAAANTTTSGAKRQERGACYAVPTSAHACLLLNHTCLLCPFAPMHVQKEQEAQEAAKKLLEQQQVRTGARPGQGEGAGQGGQQGGKEETQTSQTQTQTSPPPGHSSCCPLTSPLFPACRGSTYAGVKPLAKPLPLLPAPPHRYHHPARPQQQHMAQGRRQAQGQGQARAVAGWRCRWRMRTRCSVCWTARTTIHA